MERTIIHLDVADFAAAVECLLDRRLAGRPLIIAPGGAARAVVYDMNETAFQGGVRKGMAVRRALRRCPDARLRPPRMERYEQAMQALLQPALACSPRVECGDADGHLFVDVTGTGRLLGPAMDVAWRLERRIRADLGFEPAWSVASSKLMAKVATRLVKPRGECIVGAGEEAAFLAPLPLRLLPGIENRDLAILDALNLAFVRQAASLSREQLGALFGSRAAFVHDVLRGIDPSPVRPAGSASPTVTAHWHFGNDSNDAVVVESALYALAEQAGWQLRRQRLAARRLRITIDYSDGRRRTGRATAPGATSDNRSLFEIACRVLQRIWTRRVRIRHLGFYCERLVFPPAQLDLFADRHYPNRKHYRLSAAVDRIRERFGRQAIDVGRVLALKDLPAAGQCAVPLLPGVPA